MERVAMDLMGPFQHTYKESRWVLVVMDYFTKWPEANTIPDQEAVTVADTLVEDMFARFRAVGTILSLFPCRVSALANG